MSDDGRHGITVIAFIGSVFSPWYRWDRQRGKGDPTNHVCLNVAVYGDSGKRWAMTDRPRSALFRDTDWLKIGPSSLHWENDELVIRIDETTAPIPSSLKGTIRVHPRGLNNHTETLDAVGRHRWSPMAPSSRVTVALESPALSWSGTGYFDSNAGDEPLEKGFQSWTWSRTALQGRTAILYETKHRRGSTSLIALTIDDAGNVGTFKPPEPVGLPSTRIWRIHRSTRADYGRPTRVTQTLEDTPFYSRSVLDTRLLGENGVAVNESVDLDRFTKLWVQVCLPWKVPRARR